MEDLTQRLCDEGLLEDDATQFDGYESAITGFTEDGRIVYDYYKIVERVMEIDKCDSINAMDYIDFNMVRMLPVMGDHSPVIMYPLEKTPL